MKGPEQLFDVHRTIDLTRESRIGQTFVTGPETTRIVRIRAFLGPDGIWQPGEGVEMVLWDSPAKKVSLGRYTIWYEFRGFAFRQAEWEINAAVQPNKSYYFELGYVGEGDGTVARIGVMNGTDAYPNGQGYLAGAESDFDICFQTHCKKTADRTANLKKAFARFSLDRPELASIREAVQKEDFETAIARTIAYFEARQSPTAIIDPKQVPTYNANFDTKAADMAVRNCFDSSDSGVGYAGPDLNWRAEVNFDERGFMLAGHFDLNRYGPRGTLGRAYLSTGNEKYAKKLNDFFVDWYLDNPPPGESHIGGCPWDSVWASLQTGIRMGHAFYAYSSIHKSPFFTPDCRMAFILGLADHADTLVLVGADAGGNWAFTQNGSLLHFAWNFPEYTNSKLWEDTAGSRLAAAIKKDILPDGVETESAPGYQRFAYNPLKHIYQTMQEREVKTLFGEELRGILERQAEYFMYVSMPDGMSPRLGDMDNDDERSQVRTDAAIYGRADLLYVGTAGKEGVKPKELSKMFPYAGIVTMRSDWGDTGRPIEDARYLMLHGVHFGAHGHADLNSIASLYAYGREILTDPGRHIYGAPEHATLNTAPVHNLLTIDGADQNRSREAKFRNWTTSKVADYLSSWADVYKGGAHTREVFLIRANGDAIGDYWVVRDTASGVGTHKLEQRWHFGLGDVSVDKTSLTASTGFPDRGNLAIMQVSPSRLQVNEITTDCWRYDGVEKPPSKLPTLIYELSTALPAAIDTVLLPYNGTAKPKIEIKTIESGADGLDSAFRISQGKVTDLFVFQRSVGEKSIASERAAFNGERVFVRRVGGKLKSALLVNGSSLTVDGKQVVKLAKPVGWAVVTMDGGKPKVTTGDAM